MYVCVEQYVVQDLTSGTRAVEVQSESEKMSGKKVDTGRLGKKGDHETDCRASRLLERSPLTTVSLTLWLEGITTTF